MGEDCNLLELDKFLNEAYMHFARGANIKVVIFDQRDLEFVKLLKERYKRFDFPFYLSLGNPYPPGHEEAFNTVTENIPMNKHELFMHMLVERYKILFEDIQTDPILSQMRFLPQWHTFVWGNAKGK